MRWFDILFCEVVKKLRVVFYYYIQILKASSHLDLDNSD